MLIQHVQNVVGILSHPFASMHHFLDLIISNPEYKLQVLQNLTKEKYYISKFIHTSFLDLDEITHMERNMLLKFIGEDKEQEQKQIMKLRQGSQ